LYKNNVKCDHIDKNIQIYNVDKKDFINIEFEENDSFFIQSQCRFINSLQSRKLFNAFWRKICCVVIDQYVFEFAIVVFWRSENIINVRYRIRWNNNDIHWNGFMFKCFVNEHDNDCESCFQIINRIDNDKNDFVLLSSSMTNSLIEILLNEISKSMFNFSKNWVMKFSFWLFSNSIINCFKRCSNFWRDFYMRLRFAKRFLKSSRFFFVWFVDQ
jgi:hypothetical protein